MSNDSVSSDTPFGEVESPKKKKSPLTAASVAKSAAAAASVRANILDPDDDFASVPAVQRIPPIGKASAALGDLPEVDDFAEPAKSPKPVPVSQSHEIPQLVLKAIFGVSVELDCDEILRRARALPQIKSVNLVGLAECEAIEVLQRSLQSLGFGADEPLTLRVGESDIDFIKELGVTLAVLTNGGYAAGVRETLIIVARELARLV